MTRGRSNSNCRNKKGRQATISEGLGLRFPGGRCFRTLQMKTSSRRNWIASRILVRRSPDFPTKGRPSSSSVAPGASPTITKPAFGFPSPGT